MLQTRINNEIRLREKMQISDRQDAITGEIKQYVKLGLLLGLCKTAVSKDNKLFSNLLAFSIGGAAIGAIVGAIKYRKVSEEIFIKTQNFYASTQNNPPQENFLKIVTGYWKYEKTPKIYRGRKLLTYKAHFVFDDAYYKNNCVLLLLKNNVKYLISPCDNEHGYAYYVKFLNDKKWYELPLDYIPANSLMKELNNIAKNIISITADKAVNIGLPVLGIIAGCVAMASVVGFGAGTAAIAQSLTIISATYSIVSNSLVLALNLSPNDYSKIVSKIPNGYLNATIGITACACVDGEITKVVISGGLSLIEGRICFNKENPQGLQHIDNFFNILNMTITTEQGIIEIVK
ncbi:MAG: hypothetical protein K5685_01060 [Bacteroidales bacterium]|nr:hypothetical protein [Bacteroidales bacterium]